MVKETIINNCKLLIQAFENGDLGQTEMPENSNPFSGVISTDLSAGVKRRQDAEKSLAYFTLPMALNYQRNSYELWKSALMTFNDSNTKNVFDVRAAAILPERELRDKLCKYKLALQPNKHIDTWQRLARTINKRWGTISDLLEYVGNDYLKLKQVVQNDYKKDFPYLSGPKIFNYWCYILTLYCGIDFKNTEFIEIAPDTHITKCSVKLGVITKNEAETLTKEQISAIWRKLLHGSEINPIDMHAPLWFWSRNGFIYELP